MAVMVQNILQKLPAHVMRKRTSTVCRNYLENWAHAVAFWMASDLMGKF
jgi:hypothetical protein